MTSQTLPWPQAPLEDVCVPGGLVRGPFGGSLKKTDFVSSGFQVYEQRHAINGSAAGARYFITAKKFSDMKRFSVRPGDFIVSCSGTIGRIFQVPEGTPEGVINQALLKITVDPSVVDPRYFLNYFRWDKFQDRILDSTQGGAMQNLVGMPIFKATPITLPPLHEQMRIAEALADSEDNVKVLEQLIAKKHAIKQGLMQQLLTCKTRLRGYTDEWQKVSLGDIADKRARHSFVGGPFGSSLTAAEYVSRGVRILQLQNIGDGEFRNEYAIFTSADKADQLLANNIYPGDILIAKMGDPVARACIVPNISDRYVMASDGIRLAVDVRRFDAMLIKELINRPEFRDAAEAVSTGSTRKRISLGALRRLKVFLPVSIDEQAAIAQILSDADAGIAVLRRRRSKALATKQGMMQELLTGRTRLPLTVDAA